MPVTAKPKAKSVPAGVDVDTLITKGGSAPEPEPQTKKTAAVTLRIPTDMLEHVDAAVRKSIIPLPRHTWILHAIHEKLSRKTA